MELFDLIFIMIGESNPIKGDTQSMVSLFYREAFIGNDKGTGAAIAILLMLIIGLLTAIQFSVQRRWLSLEGSTHDDQRGAHELTHESTALPRRAARQQCLGPRGAVRRPVHHALPVPVA